MCLCVPQSLSSSFINNVLYNNNKEKTKRTKDNQKWVYMWIMEDRKKGVTRMTLITTEEHR